MKSLHISSFSDERFKNLIRDKFFFHLAVKNYIKDQYELGNTLKNSLAIVVSSFAGKEAGESLLKSPEKTTSKILQQQISHLLRLSPEQAVVLFKNRSFRDILRENLKTGGK